MNKRQLRIHEIFLSIQGESTRAGLRCVFVRLQGCPLRCHYCDTSYAFDDGALYPIDDIIAQVQTYNCPLVEITGGEPLMQHEVHVLMKALCDLDFEVMLETSGQLSIAQCDPRVSRIVDIKTPNSGASGSFLEANYDHLCLTDEIKFVIMNREDFDWALSIVRSKILLSQVHAVHFSPVMRQEANGCVQGCDALPPEVLAGWIQEAGEDIRLHLQLHRYVWAPDARGV